MKDDLWLAVGEYTGNWDELTFDEQFLGVGLVIAKLSDWKLALEEQISGQTVLERMKQPLQNLPKGFASNSHHVKNALDYFKTQSVRGLWSLDNKMASAKSPLASLKNELSVNLGWLAKHAKLITLCTYGTADWVRNHLRATDCPYDYTQVLGRAYGLLVTLIIPFFNKEDNLLIALPSPAPLVKTDGESLPNEQDDDIKGLCSSLLNHAHQNLRVWQHSKIAHYNCGTFTSLQQNLLRENQNNDNISLEMIEAFLHIADLSAALMTLSQNTQGDIRLHDPNSNWHNVNFFKFEELLP
ncbi:MAG: hypothetical protein DRR16_31645 [Candidatus Parabeggiatoa sp. nov. 3]|nr:MAG: hypothetical protein DRQ99_31625 [Gammaproteobacteria bacterium]RKZ75029.1 MAG: hypothetical protein DRR16_31645 [Gammaproteobacteria bacterium]HEW98144.1 hypothetical protein [Beggiatoa sp.]